MQRAEGGDAQAGDAAFNAYARRQQLRQCPKCTYWVEKTSGCDAMHCRCNLVFCFKCGGVLRQTSRVTNIKACQCGEDREFELRAHEGAPNHNLRSQAELEADAAAAAAAQNGWHLYHHHGYHAGAMIAAGAIAAGYVPPAPGYIVERGYAAAHVDGMHGHGYHQAAQQQPPPMWRPVGLLVNAAAPPVVHHQAAAMWQQLQPPPPGPQPRPGYGWQPPPPEELAKLVTARTKDPSSA